jgi:hypothetical protein
MLPPQTEEVLPLSWITRTCFLDQFFASPEVRPPFDTCRPHPEVRGRSPSLEGEDGKLLRMKGRLEGEAKKGPISTARAERRAAAFRNCRWPPPFAA